MKYPFFIFLASISIIISCSSETSFSEYKSIPQNKWTKNDSLSFEFQVHDTITKNNIFITIRNNNQYPFSNLICITKMLFPNNKIQIDTLTYEMTDANGQWLGKGFSEIKENKLFYKENITFPLKGNYTFSIEHAMRERGKIEGIDTLIGVSDIGIEIVRN